MTETTTTEEATRAAERVRELCAIGRLLEEGRAWHSAEYWADEPDVLTVIAENYGPVRDEDYRCEDLAAELWSGFALETRRTNRHYVELLTCVGGPTELVTVLDDGTLMVEHSWDGDSEAWDPDAWTYVQMILSILGEPGVCPAYRA